MAESAGNYQSYLNLRSRMGTALDDLAQVLRDLGASTRADGIIQTRERMNHDAFRLMVVGEFKRGKSTLINAMLGESVLPAKVAPCTAVITQVRYAPTPRAILHWVEPGKPPREVPVDRIRDFVMIKHTDEEDELDQPSPYSKLELFYPLPLCQNNVEIVDSPGLNEHATRTEVALDYLPKADALLMVLSCDQQLSQSERGFIDNSVGGTDLSHVFFLWNRYDSIQDSPDDVDDIRRLTRRYLGPRLGRLERVFYVSARDALAGRRRDDAARTERSKLPEFEEALERFLVEERGRLKIMGPLRHADTAARYALVEAIPQREALLKQPLEELERRYHAQLPKLHELKKNRERILRHLRRRRDVLRKSVVNSLEHFTSGIYHQAKEVGEEFASHKRWFDATVNRKKLKEAMLEYLDDWMQSELKKLQEAELVPMMEKEARELEQELEQDLAEFLNELDSVREALNPDLQVAVEGDDTDGPSAVNRVLSTVGGFLVGGVGGALEGGAHGYQAVIRGAPVYLVTGFALVVAGASLPVSLAIIGSIGLIRTALGGKSATERLIERVTEEFRTAFQRQIPKMRQQIDGRVCSFYDNIIENTSSGLNTLIEEVEGEVESALEEKRAGAEKMARQLARLAQARQRIGQISTSLQGVRAEIDA